MGIEQLRMKVIERPSRRTEHTRVHPDQLEAIESARPASSADTIRQWHESHKREAGGNAVQQ